MVDSAATAAASTWAARSRTVRASMRRPAHCARKTLTTPPSRSCRNRERRCQDQRPLRGGAAFPPRHHRRDQHDSGAQRRALRAADDAGLPRYLRDRPRQPAGVLQPVFQAACSVDRSRPALRDPRAHRRPGRGADQARRGRGAHCGRGSGRAGSGGHRDPVSALVPEPGARAAREGDHRAGVSATLRQRISRAQPGIPGVRAHLDRRR